MAAPVLNGQVAAPPAAPPATAPAADAPAAAPPATAPAAAAADAATLPDAAKSETLLENVDNFWHFAKIARYDMAAAYGTLVLARTETDLQVLEAFESTAIAHQDELDDWMLRWEGVDVGGMKGMAAKIQERLGKGRKARRSDAAWIKENIEKLALNERAYGIHLARLKESGELAVPFMINYLASGEAADEKYKEPIRRAMVDLGRSILNPLIAATETKDETLELTLISVLSRIGYDVAAPYLARIGQDRKHPGLAQAAESALRRMGVRSSADAADQFYRLAEKFYYNTASIQADPKATEAYIWFWTEATPNAKAGLASKKVAPALFSDIMSERAAEYALELGPGSGDALSLWLCANNKLEVDTAALEAAAAGSALNEVFDKDRPPANYYNVYAGARYLNAALTRTLNDRSPDIAIRLIKSLAQIVGPSSQGTGVQLDPLVQSMRYPDRKVRFEAAFALASGLPNSLFIGHERVAPLLAEAISQTGTANVLIITAVDADEKKLREDLKQYGLASGTNAAMGFANALKLPSVDVIVFPETLGNAEIDRIYQLANTTARLERAAKVIITLSKMSPWAQRVMSDPLTVVTQASDAAGLAAAIEEARKRAGGTMDEKAATEYAVKAAQTLQRLAAGRVTAFDLRITEQTLLASLNDKRPEVLKAVGEVLAYMNADQAQVSLVNTVKDEKTADDVRVSLLQSLAKNVKFFGGHLQPTSLDDLQKLVDTSPTAEVKVAAAEARGALNLPAEQAKELIVKQAKR
jgi:hypothetical protein